LLASATIRGKGSSPSRGGGLAAGGAHESGFFFLSRRDTSRVLASCWDSRSR
jgi:hypothetical protein